MGSYDQLREYIHKQPFFSTMSINLEDLKFDPMVRTLCEENKCGQYGKNYMCPPHIDSVATIESRLDLYEKAIVVVLKKHIMDSSNRNEFYEHAEDLHTLMLDIEKEAKKQGYINALALIGGHCRICKPCKINEGTPCKYPSKARTSMEALGIHVIDTCKSIGVDIEFRKDQVVWVGLLMI